MTEPRYNQRQRQTTARTTDQDPEVRPEVIQDLDVTGADAGNIAGGGKSSQTYLQ